MESNPNPSFQKAWKWLPPTQWVTLTLFAENRGMSYFRNPSSKNRQILFLENPNILLTLLIYRITALVNNRSGSPLRTMESTDPEKIV